MLERYIISQSKGIRLLAHVLFWCVHILVLSILLGSISLQSLLRIILALPFQMAFVYVILYWAFPKFLLQNRYLLFISTSFALLLATSTAIPLYSWLLEVNSNPFRFNYQIVLSYMVVFGYMASLAVGIKLLKYWILREKFIGELATAKLQAELKFLKAQIHPHFLFNTLNNLYSLTIKQSPNAPIVVEKISELLRYISYEVTNEMVPLKQEINCIENYIALEKIRHGENLEVSFDIDVDNNQKEIAPLLLLPFVENACKHSSGNSRSRKWITIHLSLKNGKLIFIIENSIDSLIETSREADKGIGLINVARRLELIYPLKYDLQITRDETYLVNLRLDI